MPGVPPGWLPVYQSIILPATVLAAAFTESGACQHVLLYLAGQDLPVLVTSSVIADTAEADSIAAAAVLRAKKRIATRWSCAREVWVPQSGQAFHVGLGWAVGVLGYSWLSWLW